MSDDTQPVTEFTEAAEDTVTTESVVVEDLGDAISGDEALETTETVVDDDESAADGDGSDAPVAEAGAAEDGAEDETEELVDEGEVAADYLEALLDIADLDGDIDITVENDRAALSVIEVNKGDLMHLVGSDGKVLSALQDLTRLAVTRETGHRSRLMLDIAGHRATRRAELQRVAQKAIAEAKESGEAVRMAPMSAFERKVVHDEVAASGLSSESEGTDPQRYVVITPA